MNGFRFRVLFLMLAAFFCSAKIAAQQTDKKVVGVYLSSKGFSYNEYANFPLGQLVRSHFGEDYVWEQLKQEALIAIGEKLVENLKVLTAADSVYFINAVPEESRLIADADESQSVIPLNQLYATDVVKVDRLEVNRNRTTVMVTERNQLRAKKVYHYQCGLSWRLLNEEVTYTSVCIDQKGSKQTTSLIDIYSRESNFGQQLSALFTMGWLQLQTGDTGKRCD